MTSFSLLPYPPTWISDHIFSPEEADCSAKRRDFYKNWWIFNQCRFHLFWSLIGNQGDLIGTNTTARSFTMNMWICFRSVRRSAPPRGLLSRTSWWVQPLYSCQPMSCQPMMGNSVLFESLGTHFNLTPTELLRLWRNSAFTKISSSCEFRVRFP